MLYLPFYEENYLAAHPFRATKIPSINGRMGHPDRRVVLSRERGAVPGLRIELQNFYALRTIKAKAERPVPELSFAGAPQAYVAVSA